MFSRWTFARLKVAENALDEGRIDEAYQRLSPPDIRSQRKARGFVDTLGKALMARARLHAQAGRYRDALEDLDRIEHLERLDAEGRALRARVAEEQQQRIARHAERDGAFHRAQRDIQAGRLDSGQLQIERLEDPQRREELREELDIRVQRGAQILDQARELLSQGEVLAACRYWDETCQRHGRSRQTDALAGDLARAARVLMDQALRSGRLDQLRAALDATHALRTFTPSLAEFERLAKLLHAAAERLAASDYDGLRDTLLRIQAARPGTDWVKAALKPLDEILHAQGALLASPLGLLGTSLHKTAGIGTAPAEPARQNPAMELTHTRGAGITPGRGGWLMLVDGTGSLLLLAADTVRIGRAGGLAGIEVPIPGDILSQHADIVRDGGDYFLVAHGPTRVNHRDVRRTLLRHGDRIVLGANARMVFHKPSAKSETAVLKLSTGCRLPQDVSLVVLFKDTCLVGPQASCHVQTREGDTRLVLFERCGELLVRRAGRDGRPTGAAEGLPARQTCEFGDLRVTVKEYVAGDSGGLA